MKPSHNESLIRLSLLATTATTTITSVHHIYRLGLEVLAPAVIVVVLPVGLMLWFRSSGSRVALWGYALLTGLVFLWFGFIDGFLDHVLKALGMQNTTFLPGGEAEVVETAFSLWSPRAGTAFYEGTGIVTFVASVVAVFYAYRLLRASRSPEAITNS
ncbi:hypothetical protein AB0M43_21430 [Longispora sp. NPDC051575]|uniref:hypothetical protein n=1 Tax=Longispora sp. NPDC051575 TaxID=3154943 RepID=UPI00343D0FFC